MFWAEAIATGNYLRNRLPSAVVGGKTPSEMFMGLVPDAYDLKVFGCAAFVQVPAQLRRKFDKCSLAGIFVGFEENKKAWRVLCQSSDGSWELHLSRDVSFDENVIAYDRCSVAADTEDAVDIGHWLETVLQVEQQQDVHTFTAAFPWRGDWGCY